MALKHGFLDTLLAASLIFCYASAQGPTTPANNGCQNVTCEPNQVCRMVEVQCIRAPCDPQPSCVASTPVCDPDPCVGLICLYGRAKDENGCIMCGCNQPCYGITCRDGYSCEPTKDPTTNTYIGSCVATVTRPQCAVYNCTNVCRFGYKLDKDDCQMGCTCYDPCEGYCPENKRCMMTADDCPEGEECRDAPMPYCTDITDPSSTLSPSLNTNVCGPDPCAGMVCLYGKARDRDGCITCDCYDPCHGFNCPEGQECRPAQNTTAGTYGGQCVLTVTRPPCQMVTCGTVSCRYGFKSDRRGCQTCECRDPCQGHYCPDNQRCVVSADDCPEGGECRDAPMPYCVDSSTTTMPPTPQSSTANGRGERGDNDGQEALLQCCASSGMSETCRAVCSTNITLLYSNLETLSGCFQYLGSFLRCASGGSSHMNCCKQRGISESCLYLCSGNETFDMSNPHAVTQCVISSSQTVLSCFNEGLTDANMTVLSTSTPSPTTAEDICSLAPLGGNCRGSLERWYYSAVHRACATFTYGGCNGNGNNFLTRDECLNRCRRSGSVCADVQCSSPCQITLDQYGCHTCNCGNDCRSTGCPTYQDCLNIAGHCPSNGTNCPLEWLCVPKPDVICEGLPNCTLSCPTGFMTDSTGCYICQCKTCPSDCPGMICLYGRVKGRDGCDTCDCYDPCQNLSCPDQCHVMRNNTTGTYYGECYSAPTRAPTPAVTRPPKPSLCLAALDHGMSCQSNATRWFYNQSANACSPFSFGGCQGNDNNFQSKQTCEALCMDSNCPELDCRSIQNCPYGLKTDDEGCSICQCFDPCEGMQCLGNTVCVSHKSDCAESEACRDPFTRMCIDPSSMAPTTTAVSRTTSLPNNCPLMALCSMFCVNGFEKDSKGCDMCTCRDPCKNCTVNQTCVRMAIDCPANDQRCANTFLGNCIDKEVTASSPTPTSSPLPASPTTQPPCRMCRMFCPYGMLKGSDGCTICRCYEPCGGVDCMMNSICQVFENDCSTDPDCPPNIKYRGRCVETTSVASSTTTSAAATSSPIESSTSRRRCLLCGLRCSYGQLRDSDGCAICHCYNPCESIKCMENSMCQVFQNDCSTDSNCPPNIRYRGQCVDTTTEVSTTTTSVSTTPSTTKRTSCPLHPVCPNRCPYGNAKDSNGCYTCDCDDPCLGVTCNSTQICEREAAPGYCEGDMCFISYHAVCKPKCTRQVSCNSMNCTYGLAKGADGCEICQCFDPCQNVTCAANEECAVTMSLPPTAYCTVRCPSMRDCKISCEFGNVKDSSGCNMCQCYDPCQNHTCNSGETCVPDKTLLYTGPIPERVYLNRCTVCQASVMCKMACRYGYAKNMTTECNMCQCYEPCQNVTCPSGQVCMPKQQFNGRYQYVAECTETTTATTTPKSATPGCGPSCMMYCQYGMVRDAYGCEICKCIEPCQNVSCPSNQKCIVSPLENGSYTGQCTGVGCGPTCRMYCQYGMVRDANGCETCRCIEPCQNVSCRTNQKCVVSPLGNDSYTGQCIDCPMPMCLSPCFYGTKPDIYGCTTCDCRLDPCSTVRCRDGICQTRLFCPDSVCTPSPVCVDGNRPCDGLQEEYQRTFGNNIGKMPQLNCDSRGLFKPIQCSDYDCWCVDEFGTPISNRSSMQLNCYSGNQTKETLKIEADINVIKLGDGWRFKQQVSQQLSNRLEIDESLVTIRKYVKGSIVADVVIGSNANTDMISVQDKLNLAKLEPFNIMYDNETFQAILLGGPMTTTSPLATPESTVGPLRTSVGPTGGITPTAAGTGTGTGRENILMIILVCVFVPIGFVAIAATIWFACKFVKHERVIPPRRLSEKSGASTEIDSLESGSDKVYPNEEFSSTITKDEKTAAPRDTTEA